MSVIESYPNVRQAPFEPAEQFDRWREAGEPIKRVVLASGQETWLVLERDAAQYLLDQTDSLTSDMTARGFPIFRAGKPSGTGTSMLPRMDPPLHTEVRRYFASFFTAKRIAGWKPEIERIVDEALEDMLAAGSPADLFEEFAMRIPSQVICLLLGVDYGRTNDFRRLAEANASSLIGAEERNVAIAELYGIIDEIFAEKRENPTDGIVSELLRVVDSGRLTREAAVGNTFVLAVGGQETTAFTIALGALQLLQRPELVSRILDEPDKIPVLIEEMLRTQGIVDQVICRAVTKPIEVGGQRLDVGDGFVVTPEAVNHDPAAYPDPHQIDLDRAVNSSGHLAFGSGIHSCIGQNLARVELQAVFSRLFQRVPTLRLAENDAPEFRFDPFIFGVRRLPVAW